jgi:hypothetical protein
MMLFWAGLCGAVGVVGFKGQRKPTVPIVVLTVQLFGGTTARIPEDLVNPHWC